MRSSHFIFFCLLFTFFYLRSMDLLHSPPPLFTSEGRQARKYLGTSFSHEVCYFFIYFLLYIYLFLNLSSTFENPLFVVMNMPNCRFMKTSSIDRLQKIRPPTHLNMKQVSTAWVNLYTTLTIMEWQRIPIQRQNIHSKHINF